MTSVPSLPLVQGHRGALYLEPENTLAGFARAAEVGASWIELDVLKTADDHTIVFHGKGTDEEPGDISELTTSEGNVRFMKLAQVRKLVFKPSAFPCPKDRVTSDCRIPTLEEALACCRKAGLCATIELKGPDVETLVVDTVRKMGMLGQVNLSSFNHARTVTAKTLEPAIKTSLLFGAQLPSNFIAIAKDCGASQVDLRYDQVTAEHVVAAHQAGLKVMAWFRGPENMVGITEEDFFEPLITMGVDVICTNQPDVLARLRESMLSRSEGA
eukprot:CAMPEP_0114542516 /NCGR_PEP_ID=MMETSP0114-20121206/1876_1 /TAXON_ID=31324 /ORGANISM="Goniomonas sp, Strain m" /LENGTH=270 /DNA_ID=CAMNT_0001726817 /DNA_START=62 /DNA_END=874 /DNA_ORIENTATION=-